MSALENIFAYVIKIITGFTKKFNSFHKFFVDNSEVILVVLDGLLCDSRLILCDLTKMQQSRLGCGS